MGVAVSGWPRNSSPISGRRQHHRRSPARRRCRQLRHRDHGEDLEAQQRRTLPDARSTVPGLNLVQTGGPGGLSSVFIRGSNSNHVKVLIDGIDATDPSSPNGAFDFGQMLTADVDRVEVLRGPQSGLYGSDAIGGVISIFTKKGEGPPKITMRVEGGSFGTVNQTLGFSGGTSIYDYAFNIAHYNARDVPVQPPCEHRIATRSCSTWGSASGRSM